MRLVITRCTSKDAGANSDQESPPPCLKGAQEETHTHTLTLTSTGSSGETMWAGSAGKENLVEEFFWTFISCICIFSGEILKCKGQVSFCDFLFLSADLSTDSFLPVDINTDLAGVDDGRFPVQLFIGEQSTLNVVYTSEEKLGHFLLRTQRHEERCRTTGNSDKVSVSNVSVIGKNSPLHLTRHLKYYWLLPVLAWLLAQHLHRLGPPDWRWSCWGRSWGPPTVNRLPPGKSKYEAVQMWLTYKYAAWCCYFLFIHSLQQQVYKRAWQWPQKMSSFESKAYLSFFLTRQNWSTYCNVT